MPTSLAIVRVRGRTVVEADAVLGDQKVEGRDGAADLALEVVGDRPLGVRDRIEIVPKGVIDRALSLENRDLIDLVGPTLTAVVVVQRVGTVAPLAEMEGVLSPTRQGLGRPRMVVLDLSLVSALVLGVARVLLLTAGLVLVLSVGLVLEHLLSAHIRRPSHVQGRLQFPIVVTAIIVA